VVWRHRPLELSRGGRLASGELPGRSSTALDDSARRYDPRGLSSTPEDVYKPPSGGNDSSRLPSAVAMTSQETALVTPDSGEQLTDASGLLNTGVQFDQHICFELHSLEPFA